jgi:molybdenum cofactor cytidylyltransferase
MKLSDELNITRTSRVALVGSGGKTTAMFQIAREMQPPVIVTTSTHLGDWQAEMADRHLIINDRESFYTNCGIVEGVTLITSHPDVSHRLGGLSNEVMWEVFIAADRLHCPVLIEADGSRGKPLKAPAEHEPAIPAGVDHVIVCIGASAIGQILDEEHVFRPEIFSKLSGIPLGEFLEMEGIIRYLLCKEGGLKNIPEQSQKSVVINQVDDREGLDIIMRVANKLTDTYNTINICSFFKKKTWATIKPPQVNR